VLVCRISITVTFYAAQEVCFTDTHHCPYVLLTWNSASTQSNTCLFISKSTHFCCYAGTGTETA